MSERGQFIKKVRLPPQNNEAEQALLGSIMLSPSILEEIMTIVTPRSFYSEKHRVVYDVCVELFQKGSPVDLLSVSTRLTERQLIDRVGGASFLTELVNVVPSASNAEYYAKIVQKKSTLRELIDTADYISSLGYNEEEDLDIVLDKAEKKIFEIANLSPKQKFVSIKSTLSEAWDRIEKLHEHTGELRGTPTGFPELDSKLAGLQNSDLIILAARPSMGKTSLAMDIARQAATKHNITVGIFSLEMSSQQLVDRMLAAESYVDSWHLRTGKLSRDEDFAKIRDALDKLSRAPIFIDDAPDSSIINMRATARRLKAEHNLGLIVVDYLQLMATSKSYDSLVQQVTEISRSLKGLARELNVPVLALSQLSRAVEARGGEPRLSDLRDSGSIEQDADVVMFIHREDKYDKESTRPNVAKIIIAKHRNGPTGEAELYFDEKRVSFVSIDKSGNAGGDGFGGF
ncbi:MAG: replicative DNA helicase [Candidatus Paceibacterota bacterium]|jgi:replicative DNA helicase